jgi:hypothetical protein
MAPNRNPAEVQCTRGVPEATAPSTAGKDRFADPKTQQVCRFVRRRRSQNGLQEPNSQFLDRHLQRERREDRQ